MSYKIITDRKLLEDFVNNFLPQLAEGQKYYLSLFARNKYAPDANIGADKAQLKRFVSDKQRLINKIEQLEIPLGTYKQFTKGKEPMSLPQECLALYINPNPRDMRKATFKLTKKLLDLIETDSNFNIHNEALSQIQQSSAKKVFMDFDFDSKELDRESLLNIVTLKLYGDRIINLNACHFLMTRGGFHLLVEIAKIEPQYKQWYQGISSFPEVDIKGDNLIPVPGTYQGRFTPYFQKI